MTPGPTRARPSRQSLPRALAVGFALLVLGAAAYFVITSRDGVDAPPLTKAFLRTVIIGGPLPIVVNVLAVLGALFIVVRRPTKRRLIVGGIVAATAAIVALVIFWVSTSTNAFGISLSNVIGAWTVMSLVTIALALASFPISSEIRNIGNVFVVLVVVLAAIVGINGNFGLDPTIATLAGISTQPVVVLPPIQLGPGSASADLLWAHWQAPEGMPSKGRTAQVRIPATVSGFIARRAGLYLPPAALVKNPPALPLVIMMMGQPGNPDPAFQAQVLDRLAAKHHGLAPIVIVADQIGSPSVDTLCLNTKVLGNAQKYITSDVVNWARTHLHIDQDPAHWVIAGYSNGGECAAQLGATYPNIWENVIDVSGEEYEGWQQRSQIVASLFHGNWTSYSTTWPTTTLSAHHYPDSVGVFTAASNDPIFKPQTVAVANAARAANWKTTLSILPNAGHGEGALVGGLKIGYSTLYPRLGLSDPSHSG